MPQAQVPPVRRRGGISAEPVSEEDATNYVKKVRIRVKINIHIIKKKNTNEKYTHFFTHRYGYTFSVLLFLYVRENIPFTRRSLTLSRILKIAAECVRGDNMRIHNFH